MIQNFFSRRITATFVTLTLSASALATTSSDQVIGKLPYSNQWVFEQPQAYLYLAFDRGTLAREQILAGSFTSDFGNSSLDMVAIDYFAKIFGFSSQSDFSLWGKYSFGGGIRKGKLQDPALPMSEPSQTAYLTALKAQIAPVLCYHRLSWLMPYLGIEISPVAYRHSSALTGAEFQGLAALYGFILGVHAPAFFENRATLMAELHSESPWVDRNRLFGSDTNFTLGAGLVF